LAIITIQSPATAHADQLEIIDCTEQKESGHLIMADAISARVPGAGNFIVDRQSVR
jgi:hypothetical protein